MRVLTPQPSHLWSFGPENRRDEHVHVDFLCRIHTDPILLGQVHPDSLYNQESHCKETRAREGEVCALSKSSLCCRRLRQPSYGLLSLGILFQDLSCIKQLETTLS